MATPRNRRQFLKDTLAIPAGAAALNLGWTVTTGCAKPEMSVRSGIKTSCCAYSYRQLPSIFRTVPTVAIKILASSRRDCLLM